MSLLEVFGANGLTVASHLLAAAVAATLLGFEVPRRVAGLPRGSVGPRSYLFGFIRIVSQCAPEMLAITFCLTTAVALRVRGDVDEEFDSAREAEIWQEIKEEWPILLGADTLLNFQTWLRLAVLTFAVDKTDRTMPLSGLAAPLFFLAILCRSVLSTQTPSYRLDGPLAMGGDLPIAIELAMLPRLATLSFAPLLERPKTAVALAATAITIAWFHFLNLAENPTMDRLFSVAHTLETFAAGSFLYTTVTACLVKGRSHTLSQGFTYVTMAMQAGLSAYYFTAAFTAHPKLVGGGNPFVLLTYSNLIELCLYLASLAIFIASCLGKPPPAPKGQPECSAFLEATMA